MIKNYNSLPTDKIEIIVYSLLLPEEKCQNSMLSAYCIHTVIKLKNIKLSHWKSSTIYTWFQNFWLVGFFFFNFIFIFNYVYGSGSVCGCVHVSAGTRRGQKSVDSPGAGATGSCGWPHLSAGTELSTP